MTADGLGIITAPQPGAAAVEKCVFDEMTNRSLLEGNHRHTQHHMCTNAIKAQYIIVFAHFYTRSKCLTLVVAERERDTRTRTAFGMGYRKCGADGSSLFLHGLV